MEMIYPWAHFIGRVLFSLVFIASGINHFTQMQGMVGYATSKKALAPKLAVPLTGLVSLFGGIAIVVGWQARLGAWLIFIFMVLTSFLMHNFWKETEPMAKMNEMIHFQKDMALGGAALFIAYYADQPWPMSLGG